MTISVDYIDEVIARGPYEASWESLSRHRVPEWFSQAKFGIFTHWGLYTVPEFGNEWYSRNMYIEGSPEFQHHVLTYGAQKDFGYKDFIAQFTAENFDASQWLEAFADAGAQYYVPVSEHHDGYQMYASALSPWNTVETGPHRDIIAELKQATQDQGLHFATSNHRAEHWWFMGHGREFDSDISRGLYEDFYGPAQVEPDNQDIHSRPEPSQEFLEDWLLRNCEIVDKYQPEIMYFDWWIQHTAFKPYVRKFAAFYYNRAHENHRSASICSKDDAMAWGSSIIDVERGGFDNAQPFVWQMDTSIARNSWSYTRDLEYKSATEIITTLVDVVSKNGNLLLNVGPRADGSLAPYDRELLHRVGTWLRAHGEGIYASRPWKIAGEGPTHIQQGMFSESCTQWTSRDIRFTTRDGFIYAFCMNPEGQQDVLIRSFARYHNGIKPVFHGEIAEVELLGYGSVSYERRDEGLRLPVIGVDRSQPIAYKISVK
ncbi:alpha-L-fucosidase [Alloscardovia criceti]|uniref:alpha-L-fucosidase n=1 Tax=Alloscardovia criceti TaxID=356828 RepID=UPI00036FE1F1|nr:alpha-L-fucosidase [Alloscardovia criceti]